MLNVRELRSLASRLTEAFFCNQIGRFALVQKPPRPVVEQMAMRMGAQSTMAATGPSLEAMQLAVMLRFDELMVGHAAAAAQRGRAGGGARCRAVTWSSMIRPCPRSTRG